MALNILEGVLGEYYELGFTLNEYADHTTELHFKDNFVAYFTQSATVENIRKTCQKYLDELNGGEK